MASSKCSTLSSPPSTSTSPVDSITKLFLKSGWIKLILALMCLVLISSHHQIECRKSQYSNLMGMMSGTGFGSSNIINNLVLRRKREQGQDHSSSAWTAHDGTLSDAGAQNEAPATNTPSIESLAENRTVEEGKNVVLPCEVRDLGPFVQLWRKGSTLLFAGSLRVHQDPRIRLRESSLEIENVHTNDTGPYICQISTNPTIEITHYLSAEVRKPQDALGTSRVPSGCRTKYYYSNFLFPSFLSILAFYSTFSF